MTGHGPLLLPGTKRKMKPTKKLAAVTVTSQAAHLSTQFMAYPLGSAAPSLLHV